MLRPNKPPLTMIRLLPILLAVALAGPAAAQPFSQSLAQCAALYDVAGTHVRTPERAARLDAAAETMFAAALEQAAAEGRADPRDYATGHRASQAATWVERGARFVFSRDFVDWAAYCRSFAKSRGIALDLPG